MILKSITKDEALRLYCRGCYIYVTNDKRTNCKIPPSYDYGSHASQESLFYRGLPKGEGENKFFTEWTSEWKIVKEGNDENDNPTIWYMDFRGTDLEKHYNAKFIYISINAENKYVVEKHNQNNDISLLKECKTFASAKRWVTMNILNK